MNNLALLYQTRKRCDLAEPLFREVVEASRRKLGPAPSGHRAAHAQSHLVLRGTGPNQTLPFGA